ncbi:leucine-rich repeat neuronal protein 3 [Callorhinchus milii]|uniref:Leucine rich repeat neuronal 3 n=1 Tax=Callorhinchus milii TaxID=7868 RepID=A0A4W3IWH0_CALMI|nr:leucine-rich repeat neuronal protein 3 [Callorhinchus milii]|eukprot:gi/632973787/ref/XP_007903323.1/ PREDICTED: leucine-rich repeat neuronal protein 3 [Callorhinchus milii]
MKDMSLGAHLLVGLAIAATVRATERSRDCPKVCTCEVRPWFTPRSAYMEAPTTDCSDLSLTAFPHNLPSDTQVVLLQSNNISQIKEPIDLLVNLTEIDLSQNNFFAIGDINLGQASRLMSLHLEENRLTELPKGCLSGLGNLQELFINHNHISRVAHGAFSGLARLLRLHLNANRLASIESQWFKDTPSLEILAIGENAIAQIQDMNFKPLVSLRSLVMAGMRLTQLGDKTLVGLDSLESISLYDNGFRSVPHAALQRVPSLKFLDLNKNPIQRIKQGDFRNMLHLKELGINNMAELVSIDGLALDNLPELTKIEATNNPKLCFIHPNAFYRVPQMETLMISSNALSALYRGTVESLPKLQEISLHSNPIRCDCVNRWINAKRTRIRFMEPQSLFCVDPPEFKGQRVREVPFREMTDTCLPLISSESFPSGLNMEQGSSVSLHCRATGQPEPEMYWITPAGDKLLPHMATGKYRVHLEGTLDIVEVAGEDSGLYTCVAHNLLGSDLRTAVITVNGSWPRRANDSFKLRVREVTSHSILVTWEAVSNSVTASVSWSAAGWVTYTVRAPTDLHLYNLTHLNPATEHELCVRLADLHGQTKTTCVNVTTNKGLDHSAKGKEASAGLATVTALGTVLGVVSLACLYFSWNMDCGCLQNDTQNEAVVALPLDESCVPLMDNRDMGGEEDVPTLELEATVIDVSAAARKSRDGKGHLSCNWPAFEC